MPFDFMQIAWVSTVIPFTLICLTFLWLWFFYTLENSFARIYASGNLLEELSAQDKTKSATLLSLLNDMGRLKEAFHSCRLFVLVLLTFSVIYFQEYQFAHSGGDGRVSFAFVTTLIVVGVLAASRILSVRLSCRRLCAIAPLVASLVKYVPAIGFSANAGKSHGGEEENGTPVENLPATAAANAGVQRENQKNMLKSILRFGKEIVGDVMTPRANIVGVQSDCTYEELLQVAVESNFSRLPVFEADSNSDQVKGVLYIKDLFPFINSERQSPEWQELIRPPFFVPERKRIDGLLKEFQSQKLHIAVVVDEYGCTSGIITMEDILEEIVGEINDEYDEEERNYVRIDNRRYMFQGQTPLSTFYDVFGASKELEEAAGEAETLAGLLLELCDGLPAPHQRITYGRFAFEVVEMDERRILKIKVTLREQDKAGQRQTTEKNNG